MISEPHFSIFRRSCVHIVTFRILRLMVFFAVMALVWRFFAGPLNVSIAGFFAISAIASITLSLIPRRINITDDHVSMRIHWIWVKNPVDDFTKPLLLQRRLSKDLTHVIFVFPTGLLNLIRIVPQFDLIVEESDLTVIEKWAKLKSLN